MARTRTFQAPNSMGALNTWLDTSQRNKCNMLFTSGGLAIHGTASALAKFANTLKFIVDGVYASKATADCAALSGTVTNATFNVYVFSVLVDGTLKTRMGTGAATRAGVVFPTIPDGEVVIGFVEINPTGTGDFVGGTTALDDATVVPNAVYVNTPFPFIPGLQAM
jgi:hypothetical protein